MEQPNSIKISNIWHNHLSSLHEPLFFLSHPWANNNINYLPKAFASTRPSISGTTSTSIAKPSPVSLEYALTIEPRWSLITPIPSCPEVPKEHTSKFYSTTPSISANHTCEVFLTLFDLHKRLQSSNIRLKGVTLKALLVEAQRDDEE